MKEKSCPNRIFMDFDNTISLTKFNEYTGKYDMGPVLPGMKEAINTCAKDHSIVIYTSRPKEEWKDVTLYLAEHGITFDSITKKPLGIAYVDDRNMSPSEFVKAYIEAPDDGKYDSSGELL